ncbi:MAG: lysophospholipid acyltransferase family protein [Gammaproteobacteria bacterium]
MSNPSDLLVANVGLFIRSILFFLGFVISTVIIASLVLMAFFLPLRYRYGITKIWTRFNIWSARSICGITYAIDGAEHIPSFPVIVLSKHQSTWETLFLHQLLPPIAWVLKRELFWVPFFGWALALVKPIAIDRKAATSAIRQILTQGKEHLDKGQWVLIFPEGTRIAPGQRGRYRAGGAMLAAFSGYPVLPIAHNAGEFWPRRGFIKRPGQIRIVIGPLIQGQGKSAAQINKEVEEWIEGTMKVISSAPPIDQTDGEQAEAG